MVSFSDDSRVTARFYMSHRNARAVLDGLADHYRKADWPLKAFPDWVQDAGDVSENLGQGRGGAELSWGLRKALCGNV